MDYEEVARVIFGPFHAASDKAALAAELERQFAQLERKHPRWVEIIRMRHVRRMTFKDIGIAYGVTGGAVYTSYQKAMRWLRNPVHSNKTEKFLVDTLDDALA